MIKILFTYPAEILNEIERIADLMSDYDYLHIRKPEYSQEKMEEFLDQLSAEVLSRSILHSHYYLVHKFDLKGINLSKEVLNQIFDIEDTASCEIQTLIKSADRILVNRKLIDYVTYSAHSVEEISSLDFQTEYNFLSPIFDSISKEDYRSRFKDLKKLKKELEACDRSVIALGGLQDEHQIEGIGFEGYAVLGAVWQKERIEA
ncbi:hypothetical protein JYT72_00515 [Crocinitomix catalasitica]|nr:hypothetical protein [Crocinitomix catalasitica]